MGLKEQFEKYNIITDEDIARGIVYAWTLMVVADAKVEQIELKTMEHFACSHRATHQFNCPDWLSEVVGEALNVYKAEGPDTLLGIIQDMLINTNRETKEVLIYTLMQLAHVDGDFTNRELDVLYRMVETLDICRRDVLKIGMLYATQCPPLP